MTALNQKVLKISKITLRMFFGCKNRFNSCPAMTFITVIMLMGIRLRNMDWYTFTTQFYDFSQETTKKVSHLGLFCIRLQAFCSYTLCSLRKTTYVLRSLELLRMYIQKKKTKAVRHTWVPNCLFKVYKTAQSLQELMTVKSKMFGVFFFM